MKIHYRRFGQGKEKIIFFPGWQQDKSSFFSLVPFLFSSYSLYLLDLPGFGQTPFCSQCHSSPDYARQINFWLEEEKIKKAIIVGHSFGGKVAVFLAHQKPKKVKKLILLAPAGIPHPRWWYPLVEKIPPSFKKTLRPLTEKIFASNDYRYAGPLKPLFRKIIKEDIRPILSKIKIPTLIIWGKNDHQLPATDGAKFHQLLPQSQLKIVSGNHFFFQKYPQKTAKIIRQFIKNQNG